MIGSHVCTEAVTIENLVFYSLNAFRNSLLLLTILQVIFLLILLELQTFTHFIIETTSFSFFHSLLLGTEEVFNQIIGQGVRLAKDTLSILST